MILIFTNKICIQNLKMLGDGFEQFEQIFNRKWTLRSITNKNVIMREELFNLKVMEIRSRVKSTA